MNGCMREVNAKVGNEGVRLKINGMGGGGILVCR